MQHDYKHRQFTFCNNQANSLASLDCILVFIGEEVKDLGNCKNVVLQAKWILTELFTNASKHSNDCVICFDVTIAGEVLQIAKSDFGAPFSVVINNERKTFPADFNQAETYLIHKDDLSILCATVIDDSLVFSVKDNTEINCITAEAIYEHFGLIIITKSSDTFIYKYDEFTKTNIFAASILL